MYAIADEKLDDAAKSEGDELLKANGYVGEMEVLPVEEVAEPTSSSAIDIGITTGVEEIEELDFGGPSVRKKDKKGSHRKKEDVPFYDFPPEAAPCYDSPPKSPPKIEPSD